MNKRRGLWVFTFIIILFLLGCLATLWNLVLVKNYQLLKSLAESSSLSTFVVLQMIFGSLGFLIALALVVLIFSKLWNEMRLNQLQSEFLAAVTHELKTPLASLELSSSLLFQEEKARAEQKVSLSSEQKNKLWLAHQKELSRLKQEVETLLEAARWQSRPKKLVLQELYLESWLEESFKRWKEILGEPSHLIRTGDPLPYMLASDQKSLDLIALNLVGNAKKFAHLIPELTIHTIVHPQGKLGVFEIQFLDKGLGFDPKHRKKIFYRFFRSRFQGQSFTAPGTGLGLSLAYSASRALKLSLEAKSQGFQQGATFILRGYYIKKTSPDKNRKSTNESFSCK